MGLTPSPPQPELRVTKSSLPDQTEVVLLKYEQ